MRSRPRPSPDQRRVWNLAAGVLTVLYGVSLVVFCAAVVRPSLVTSIGLDAYADSRAWWPVLVQVVSALGAFTCFYWPRRREARSFSLLASGVLAVTTMTLGLFSYLTCAEARGQSVFWAPLTWSINLATGNVSACTTPSGQVPLTLQVARLSGPLLLVIATLGIVATLFRMQYDRLRVRYSRSLVLLVGLSEDALPLLRRLSADREKGTTLAVFADDAGNALIKIAREYGARVVVTDLTNLDVLGSLLTSRHGFKVRTFYAVSADVTVNLRWAAQLRQIADAAKPSRDDMPPRMVVRIDDPWQAEYWRRTNAYRTRASERSVRWMSDALSVYEVTAALLLDRVLDVGNDPPFDRLVIVGNSPLALAVCADLAQREREGAELQAPPPLTFADVLLFGPDAEVLREQHRLRQERFGNKTDTDLIAVDPATPDSPSLRAALRASRHPVLILADDPASGAPQLATYLAALNPGWTIYDWSTATRGVGDEPVMERLYPFGLTTEAPRSLPVDSWERAARVVHEKFRMTAAEEGWLDPTQPSHEAWDHGLDPFFKESNLRQVTTVLATAESLGRSWGPVSLGNAASLSEPDLVAMAQAEHVSWLRYHLDRRWRLGDVRDDQRRIHPGLKPWDQLEDQDKQKNVGGVRTALAILHGLGYRATVPEPPASAPPALSAADGWVTVTRCGEVSAVRAGEGWTWTNEAGGQMQAEAGDWRVTSDDGRSWSVLPDIFARTYTAVDGDRWRRTGQAHARPAVAGETITSIEGLQVARDGDWVIQGAKGEQWVTSGTHFAANYEVSPH